MLTVHSCCVMLVVRIVITVHCFHHRLAKVDEADLPSSNHTFEYKLEKDVRQVYRSIQRSLSAYKDEKKGPTYIAIQSPQGMSY